MLPKNNWANTNKKAGQFCPAFLFVFQVLLFQA